VDNYFDEADIFYQNPSKWLSSNGSSAPPNYLIFFDALLNLVSNFIASNKYKLIGNFFHADVDQGRVSQRILVFKRE
jgi:phosphatidylinositol glycan class B